jgi:anthranilate phosphoribosyltransferase
VNAKEESMHDFKPLIAKVAAGQSLSRDEAEIAFGIMMSGEATPSQIGGFLMALRVRGETVDEIAGAVATMRAKVTPVEAPTDAMDVVGTGGDAAGTYNISTSAAFVVAGVGVPVAKHGNRALSSRSGSADVLKALGVKIELTPDMVARCIREAGIGFMFAPAHHSAMKHVGPSRVELGTRTVFNLLGPLSNPAGVKRLLVGMFSPEWLEPAANVLRDLGAEAAWMVHGAGGVDEISVAGKSKVVELKDGKITAFEVSPGDVGLPEAPLDAIRGGDAEENAKALREFLAGATGPYRDTVLMNAGAALVVGSKARNLAEGVELAAASIDEGKAEERLDKLVAVSND